MGMALNLLTWSRDIVICTNGMQQIAPRDLRAARRHGLELRTAKIKRLQAVRGRLSSIVFEDGSAIKRVAAFFCSEQRQHSPLVRSLGCALNEKGLVVCDRKGRTGIDNLFLAGDANGDMQFAIVAAAEGATAGVTINRELQDEDRASESRHARDARNLD
jgi:thioredoxin reductase